MSLPLEGAASGAEWAPGAASEVKRRRGVSHSGDFPTASVPRGTGPVDSNRGKRNYGEGRTDPGTP